MQQRRNILLLLLVSVILTAIFIRPFHTASNDLSTRVNGSRLLMAGKSAYFHQWQAGESTYFLDPFAKNNQVVNGNTVTPAVLTAFAWLHALPFGQIARYWWLISCVLLGITLMVVFNTWRQTATPVYLFTLPLLFIATAAWRMHLYSGQVYILYTLLAALVFYCLWRGQLLWAGLVAGLLITMRLPLVLLLAPLAFMPGARKFAGTTACSALLFFAVSVCTTGLSPWQEYFASMKIHSLELQDQIPVVENAAAIPAALVNGVPTVTDPAYVADMDIFSVQKLLLQLHLPASPIVLYALYGMAVLTLFFMVYTNRKSLRFSVKELFLAGFALYIVSEYFLPAPRFTYNFIQWLLPFSIILFSNGRGFRLSSLLAVAGVLLNIFKAGFIPDAYCFGELVLLSGLVLHLMPARDALIHLKPEWLRLPAARARRATT